MKTRFIYWSLLNGFFVVALYQGFLNGVEAAENMAISVAWISIVLTLFMSSKEVMKEMAERGRAVPKIINVTLDVAVTLALVYGGWWITSFFYMIHSFLQEECWRRALEEK